MERRRRGRYRGVGGIDSCLEGSDSSLPFHGVMALKRSAVSVRRKEMTGLLTGGTRGTEREGKNIKGACWAGEMGCCWVSRLLPHGEREVGLAQLARETRPFYFFVLFFFCFANNYSCLKQNQRIKQL